MNRKYKDILYVLASTLYCILVGFAASFLFEKIWPRPSADEVGHSMFCELSKNGLLSNAFSSLSWRWDWKQERVVITSVTLVGGKTLGTAPATEPSPCD